MIIILAILFIIIFFVFLGYQFLKINRGINISTNNPIKSLFNSKEEAIAFDDQIMNYFPTKAQLINPAKYPEPEKINSFNPAQDIIPEIIKLNIENWFIGKSKPLHFLVLADTGMGKTTFMINLYSQLITIPLFKYHVKFIRFNEDTLNDLQKIESTEKEKTILLIDGFDEGICDFEKMEDMYFNLLSITKEFYEVVITCRTQFLNNNLEPQKDFELELRGEVFPLQKIYLSPLNKTDILKFIDTKYRGIYNSNRQDAKKLVKKKEVIFRRPFILSNIDVLIKSIMEGKRQFYTFKIYEYIVKDWFLRDAQKIFNLGDVPGQLKTFENKFIHEIMLPFSMALAKQILLKAGKLKKDKKQFDLTQDEVLLLGEKFHIKNFEKCYFFTRSLLTRNQNDNYKFAHQSLLEYFLFLNLTLEGDEISFDDFLNYIKKYEFESAEMFYLEFQFEELRSRTKGKINDKLEINELDIDSTENIEKIEITKKQATIDWHILKLIKSSNITIVELEERLPMKKIEQYKKGYIT